MLPVFLPTAAVLLLLIIGTLRAPDQAEALFASVLAWITTDFGWFYMLSVTIFMIFIIAVGFSGWGRIKLGPDHAEPEYSFPAWFAMLFSAGYGIALLFFGVAEPVLHYAVPPEAPAQTVEAAKQAMQITFFHWGFHIWAIYGLVGLVLAYFAFRHGLPLSIRSALYPLVGERIHGPIGHTVDSFAILGTVFGLATTLGLSVAQINAGLHYLWPTIPVGALTQVVTIAVITALAIFSVVAGMDKGIKRLSLINMVLAISLMLFVFIVGPTIFILETFLENTGRYLSGIVERTFNLQAYTASDWIGNWTLFIFGWTIAWAPFVGLFIAKISRGRTIRQFVFGVMLAPTIFTFLWFTVFGDTALHAIMFEGYTALIDEVQSDRAIALFKFYEYLPWTTLLSIITLLLIMTFFVTSVDSGTLVVSSLASGGQVNSPIWLRIFWAVILGSVASILLIAGGLGALQTAAITGALPFAVIMLLSLAGLWRALIIEGHREVSLASYVSGSKGKEGGVFWRERLGLLVGFPEKSAVERFVQKNAYLALKQVQKSLQEKEGWEAVVGFDEGDCRASFSIEKEGEMDFLYEVRLRGYAKPGFAYPEMARDNDGDEQYYRAEVFLKKGGQGYDIYGYETEDIINDLLDHLQKYLHFLHTSPGILPWQGEEHQRDAVEKGDQV